MNKQLRNITERTKNNIVPLTALVLALVASAFAGYFHFVSEKIHEESTNHLTEVYAQVNDKFSALVQNNWAHLDSWEHHIQSLLAESNNPDEKLYEFISSERNKWGFTDFYFLNTNGEYVTINGMTGYIDLGDQLTTLMEDRERIVVDGTLPNNAALTIFAIPVASETGTPEVSFSESASETAFSSTSEASEAALSESATSAARYQGFAYSAIAVSYNNADMEAALDVEAFGGQSNCFVVYPDGRILFSANIEENQPHNYLAYLEQHSSFNEYEFSQLRNALANGTSGTTQYRIDGDAYYLTYQPVEFQDWMMFGIVPKSIVNAAMSEIQWMTGIVFSCIFILLGVVSVLFLVMRNRRAIEGKNAELEGKDAEIQYRESLFTALVDNTEDIFVMFSADDWSVDYVSPNIENILGIPASKVMEDLRALDASDASDTSDNNYKPNREELNAISHGLCWQGERERIHQKTGERRWYKESIYCVSVKGSQKYVLVLADRTKEQETERVLRQALDIAGQANEAKSTFLANMSHDIRTPINAIQGMSELALMHIDPEEKAAEYLRTSMASTSHLLGLINDILDMSKIESGQLSLHEEPFSLDQLVADMESIIKPQANAKSQDFVINTHSITHHTFIGDSLHIKQVVLNLLSNAVKYTQEGGCISLEVCELEQSSPMLTRVRFAVSDNGMGMPQDFLDHIFDPFERSNQPGIKEIQGTGLGMPIAKSLVEAMGGVISVTSEIGAGSTFTVVLDLKTDTKVKQQTASDETAVTKHYNYDDKRFLLAEDNQINAMVLMELLDIQGATVEWAENGKQAVEMFSEKPEGYYDLIFMNVQMPVMSGYDATAAIRNLPRKDAATIHIVALTANAFAEDIQAALDAGMDAHVSKPIVMADLEQTLLELEKH